ncbi:MAG: SCO family protein [Nitriliruptoraceae bacterium]
MRAPRPANAIGPLLALGLLLTACGPASATSTAAQGLEAGPDGWHGQPVGAEQSVPTGAFTTTEGRTVELADAFLDTPTLLFFGYTNCPDICPVHLAAIASAMETAGVSYDELDVVFVSVDPDRDTPSRIEAFLDNFDPRMHGLHADREVVTGALGQLELSGPVVEGEDPRGDGDLIGHPAQVIGFDADGDIRRVWPFGARRSDWVSDLPRIVEEWS